jgi:probable O-glycosylation ligase (exosortase A-associated)
MPIRDILVAAALIGSVPFCFFRPFYGAIVWTILSFLNPHRLTWGATRDLPVAVIVAIPTILGAIFFSRFWTRLPRGVFFILVLWGWFTLSATHATFTPALMHYNHDTWFRWQVVSKILVMTIVIIGVVDTWNQYRYLLFAIAGSFSVFVLTAVPWMIMTHGQYRLYGPEGTAISDNNDFGLALNMTLPFFFFLAKSETNRRLKWFFGFLFVVTIPAIFLTYSRGALVGLVAVLFLMILTLPNRIFLLPILVLGTCVGVFMMPGKWQDRMDFLSGGAVIDKSALSRFNSWTYCWNLALDYPLTGAGFESFTQPLFDQYAPNRGDLHGPHSIYFGVLAEQGFTGLLLYLSFVIWTLFRLYRIARQARRYGEEVMANYAVLLRFSLVGFLCSGAFLGRAYFDYFFTLVGCSLILGRLWENQMAELEAEPELVEVYE